MLDTSADTLGAWFEFAKKRLNPSDAECLCKAAFESNLADLVANGDTRVSEHKVDTLREFIHRRETGEPVAYILGTQGFWHHDFLVTSDTLIPRPETETLVETVLPFLSVDSKLLDLGTGSGAIGITLAVETDAKVVLADVSEAALAVAGKNAKQIGVHAELLKSNWYDAIHDAFDCIVSNPPYVASNDPHLKSGDLPFEPPLALVGGEQGLAALQAVVYGAPAHLNPNGHLAVEHGFDQAVSVRELFLNARFDDIQLVHDLSGHPRVTMGRRP